MQKITTEKATEDLFRLAQKSIFNIAPERKKELVEKIFNNKKWRISRGGGDANFIAIVDDMEIILRHSGLASLWCLTYVSFHIMDIGSRRQRQREIKRSETVNIAQEFKELKLSEYIAYSEKLFINDEPWPDNLNLPIITAPLSSIDGRINNAFFGALSWIILHEIGHINHNDSEAVPASVRKQQEYNADEFSTKWILENAGNGIQREFKVLMISIAFAWLFLLESIRGQGLTHPPTILRFREAKKHFMLLERSTGLENSAYLLKAILDPNTIPPEFDCPKKSFEWIAKRLEELFPPRCYYSGQ